jgi:hypothetical protein
MAFEQRIGCAKFGEDLVVGHIGRKRPLGRPAHPFNTLGLHHGTGA